MKWLLGWLACGWIAAGAELRINEVFYDPTGTDTALEWVELLNTGPAAVNVGGWMLDCSGPNLVLPSLTLEAGQVLVVHNNALQEQAPVGLELWYAGTSMGNTHGFIGLWTSEEQSQEGLVDYLQYGTTGHSWESQAAEAGIWPLDAVLPDVEQGHSLHYSGSGAGPTSWYDEGNPEPGEASTVLAEPDEVQPARPSLLEVWPNPFNPETRVTFQLPQTLLTRLSLVDVLGREVRVLEDGLLPAGVHERSVNLSGQPAGCYFLRLQAGGQQSVRKLLLVK
jgi:hypothetical protein